MEESAKAARDERWSAAEVIEAFAFAAARSESMRGQALPAADQPLVHRFVFEGPPGGGDPIRIGCFAGIHGDEPAGPLALLEMAGRLAANPSLAEGYHLYFYPVCNPAGFDARSRYSASGKDLNREFWRDSREAEVRLLEAEILRHAFHGLISLHSDDTSGGMYGFVRGALLTRSLLEPALAAAGEHLPRNRAPVIDGFPAENGIIADCYDGILTSPPKLENSPFEIILESPQDAEVSRQVEALVAGSLAILREYPRFLSFAAGL